MLYCSCWDLIGMEFSGLSALRFFCFGSFFCSTYDTETRVMQGDKTRSMQSAR